MDKTFPTLLVHSATRLENNFNAKKRRSGKTCAKLFQPGSVLFFCLFFSSKAVESNWPEVGSGLGFWTLG